MGSLVHSGRGKPRDPARQAGPTWTADWHPSLDDSPLTTEQVSPRLSNAMADDKWFPTDIDEQRVNVAGPAVSRSSTGMRRPLFCSSVEHFLNGCLLPDFPPLPEMRLQK